MNVMHMLCEDLLSYVASKKTIVSAELRKK